MAAALEVGCLLDAAGTINFDQIVREDCNKFAVSALIQTTFVFYCQDNIFEWHFAVRGPPDTEFQVGPCKDYFIAKLALCLSATWSNS